MKKLDKKTVWKLQCIIISIFLSVLFSLILNGWPNGAFAWSVFGGFVSVLLSVVLWGTYLE